MSYVGLDQAPVEPSSADTCGINRSHVSVPAYMMLLPIMAVHQTIILPSYQTWLLQFFWSIELLFVWDILINY